jgi:ABC-2 type transport system permease protein
MLTIAFGYATGAFFYFILFNSAGVESVGGWDVYRMYALAAVVWIIDSIFGGVFFFNLVRFHMFVRNYDFDFILLKPVNTVFFVSCRYLNFGLLSGVFFGTTLLIYSVSNMAVDISFFTVFSFIVLVSLSVMMLYSIFLIIITFSLRFVKIDGLTQIFWTSVTFGKYPQHIYPFVVRTFFTFGIPAIAIYNFPTLLFIDGFNFMHLAVSILMTLALFIFATSFFKMSIKRYYT